MNYQPNFNSDGFVREFPDDQPPATSYPDPQKPGQMPPMNPTPDIPGTDAPEVETGSGVSPDLPEEDEDDFYEKNRDSQ